MKQLTIELTKEEQRNIFGGKATYKIVTVSYTHLTLPTNREV